MHRGLFILLFITVQASAQQIGKRVPRPKLVVGLVIDQMRYDFLYRYYERYGSAGFKRLIHKGHSCDNMMINYLPTFTGPGHACIYTGSIPAIHGIASNDWIDRLTGNKVYCTEDASVSALPASLKPGKMSPRNMFVSTISDEMRLATNFSSKTIAISVKDRGAILPGGHTANAAYWMDDSLGHFMSSSYYMKALPEWVTQFNQENRAKKAMSAPWQTMDALPSYSQSTSDTNRYEGKFIKETNTSFPHSLNGLKLSDIKKTPFGNSIVLDFAKEAIRNEKLGSGTSTDFLCVSLSSTDYIGHQFGPNSIEIEDTYLRLDRDLETFLNDLDQQIGDGNYTLFLTADHGVAHNPNYLKDQKIPAGYFYSSKLKDELNTYLNQRFGSDRLIREVGENFIWLNHGLCDSLKLDQTKVKEALAATLIYHKEILFTIDMEDVATSNIPEVIKTMAINGYHPTRSGDLLILLQAGWLDAYATTGTTHGTWNPYDTHIPMLWYGWGVKPGSTKRVTHMTDIAATLATILHIQMPNGCTGECIPEVLK